MNIFELKNTKAGFTLIEMVITLAILSVLMTSTMGMIISSNSIFISTSQAALDKQVGNGVFTLIESVVKYSTHLQIGKTKSDTMGQTLSLQEVDTTNHSGYILYYNKEYDTNNTKTATNIFDTSYYKGGRTVKYTITSVGGDNKHLRVTVTVYRGGEAQYEVSSIIKCVNLGLASGSEVNNIVVKDDAPDYNQTISFSCDEMLMAGGQSAWSVEYKVNEYLAKYNKILMSYYNHLTAANSPVTAMYSTYKDKKAGEAIFKSVAESTLNTRSQAVFGTNYNAIGSAKNFDQILANKDDSIVNNNTWNSSVSWTEGTTDPSAWKNIRAYYQKEIYDLLKYSPTTITDSTSPYYKVICGKEELYTGFLLTYYDKNKDGKVTQAEYPNFGSDASEIANFFGGTTLQKYADGSFNNDSMVILGYFLDNESSSYQTDFYSKTGVSTEVQVEITEDRLKNDAEGGPKKWLTSKSKTLYRTTNDYSGTNWKSSNHYKDTPESKTTETVLTAPDFASIGYDTFYATSTSITNKNFSFEAKTGYKYKWNYNLFNTSTSGNRVSISVSPDSFQIDDKYNWGKGEKYPTATQRAYYYSIDTAASQAISSLGGVWGSGARNISSYATLDTSATRQYKSSSGYGSGEGVMYVFKANSDLPEGWYYYKEEHWGTYREKSKIYDVNTGVTAYRHYHNPEEIVSYTYHFFLLKADYGTGTQAYNLSKIAVSTGCEVDIFAFMNGSLDLYAYQQAQYVGAGGTGAIERLEFDTWTLPKAHQYADWILYGVDWNSWFSNKSGLLNKAVTTVMSWVGNLTSAVAVGEITSVSASNAELSLGRTGVYSVNSTNYKAKSYNLAWMVYNASKGSWYYLPQNSNVASTYLSGLSFYSAKDEPRALDLQNDVKSSSWLEYLINNRKYYNEVISGKGDVNWVSIPTTAEKVTANT